LIIIGAVVIVLGVIGYLAWVAFRPAAGESVPIMANAGDHVEVGSDPGPFNSDPPTSGPHYAQEYDAGFYDPDDPEAQAEYPEGYLIHNLEHGYVIFWYNCDLLDEAGCEELKTAIQSVMDDFNGLKLIGFPRASIEAPVVMTSWGQKQVFQSFDAGQARRFIQANRYRAPEPNAP
jgi:hypothetical protein